MTVNPLAKDSYMNGVSSGVLISLGAYFLVMIGIGILNFISFIVNINI